MIRDICDHRSPLFRRLAAACGLAYALAIATLTTAEADEPITVQVRSGRSFTAQIDERSDASKLWLRFSKETSSILRPIEWSAITEITRGDRLLPMNEVREQAIAAHEALLRQPKPATPSRAAVSPTVAAPRAVEAPAPRGSMQTWNIQPASAAEPVAPRAPVRSISADAYLANWDADVESDGLFLSLAALDGTGFATPVDGTLEVELIGDRQPPLSRGNAFPVLARWTRQVTAKEIEESGGYYKTRLEFQALHPEYQLWLSSHALVHVRFLVPGDGAFEASIDAVPMRRFSPVRERAQQAFGTRFLPNEQTGRGHRESSSYGP